MRRSLWLSTAVLCASLAASPRGFAEDDPGMDAAPTAPAAPAAPVADAAAARTLFERGEVFREEGKWAEAAKAYGASLDADDSGYLTHVRYQEAVIEVGQGSTLVADYEANLKESTDAAMRLHRLRVDAPALRIDA